MKTCSIRLLGLLAAIALVAVAPAWAKPIDPTESTPVAATTPQAATTDTIAADAAADSALIKKAQAKAKAQMAEEKEAKAFCERTSDLGKQRLLDQKAECKELDGKGTDAQKATCKKVSKCVLLEAIEVTEAEGEGDTPTANVPHAARAEAGYVAPKTQTAKTGATRLGGFADGASDNPYLQDAVVRTGGTKPVVKTAVATAQDRTLKAKDAGYATNVLTAGQVPATRDRKSNATFYLSYCKEQGYPNEVCAQALKIMNRESAFNTTANPKASGHPDCLGATKCSAFGLGQYIDSTWKSACSKHLNISQAQCMDPNIRANPKAQADVLIKDINDEYQKYIAGRSDNRGLDFGAYYYGVIHHSGSWEGQVEKGLRYYRSTFGDDNALFSAAANSLGMNPTEIAQLTLKTAGNYLPANYFSTGSGSGTASGGMSIGAYANQDPRQVYYSWLMSQFGAPIGMPYTMNAYNPYAIGYGQPMFPPQTGMMGGGPIPTIIVDGDHTALDNNTPSECGGQVVDVEADVGLIKEACLEPVTKQEKLPLKALTS
ncbi:MAG: hypothetical protein ACK5YK_01295 [Pseudomonadota bacterium]